MYPITTDEVKKDSEKKIESEFHAIKESLYLYLGRHDATALMHDATAPTVTVGGGGAVPTMNFHADSNPIICLLDSNPTFTAHHHHHGGSTVSNWLSSTGTPIKSTNNDIGDGRVVPHVVAANLSELESYIINHTSSGSMLEPSSLAAAAAATRIPTGWVNAIQCYW